jgi:hypothetical protein
MIYAVEEGKKESGPPLNLDHMLNQVRSIQTTLGHEREQRANKAKEEKEKKLIGEGQKENGLWAEEGRCV